MRPAPTIVSPHKAARFAGWLRLWLVMAVAYVSAHWCAWFAVNARARDLDHAARGIRSIVFLNACARLRYPKQSGCDRHGRLKRATLRALLGSRLRHTMRGRDFASRLVALLAIVRDLDAHIDALVARLRVGLTRLRVIMAAAGDAPPLVALASDAACADTS